jgi:nitric oxide reductase NorQ protein
MAKAKKSAAELLKEAAEKAGIPMEIATILHKLGEATPKTEEPTLTAEGVESLVTSAVEEEPVEKKPPFISGKYKTLGGYFRVDEGVYAVLKRNIQKSVNTLLLGPTGVGKTELVSNIAKALDLPITIFDMGTMTDPIMSLVGNHVIKMHDGVTTSTFVKSRFSEVIQKPGIVMLDEISRAVVTSNNLLFPCLDFRRELPMEYCFEDTAPIKVHPQCVFIATANLGGQYTGTHKLDRALMDRFMIVEIDPLGDAEVKKAIGKHCPSLSSTVLSEMVRVYSGINKAHSEFTIGFSLSIRHLKMIAEMVEDGFTLYDSFYITCKGIGGTDGAKALKTIFDGESSKTETHDDDES